MQDEEGISRKGISRRRFIEASGAGLVLVGGGALLGCASAAPGAAPAAPAAGGTAATPAGKVGYFDRFGIDEGMLRRVLAEALATGGEFADVFLQHEVTTSLGLEDGAVNRTSGMVQLGAGVRVVRGDQTGYAYTEDLSIEALLGAARTAAAVASGGGGAGPVRLALRKIERSRYAPKTRWDEVPLGDKLPLLRTLSERTMAADPRVKKVNVGYSDVAGVVLVADSDGRLVEDHQPMTSLRLFCTAEHKGRRESNGYNVAGRQGLEFYSPDRLDRMVKEAIARTTILFDAVDAPVGEMPVVLAAGSSGILLHEAIGHGMEADFNRKGTSIFADRMGKAVARPFVHIVDDATQPGARGAIHVDDEGNDGQRTMLVEGGVLASYLHDRISAKHYGVKPTGNGRRESYQHAPQPRMRSTYMLPGPHRKDEILASVKRGIYCMSFTNGQVNIGAGDFTFYVKNGWLIEDGKLTRPIKDVNLIGNGPKALEQVDMVADDLVIDEGGWTCGKNGQGVPVSQGQPTCRVAQMTVGGRGKRVGKA